MSRPDKVMTPLPDLNGNGKTVDDNDNLTAGDNFEDDDETLELSKLRCTSLRTEEVASREKEKQARETRRNQRSSDFPGLAIGSAMGVGGTLGKFNLIKDELSNIMKSQLRRLEGEVTALSTRIKALDDNLEKSEQYIKTATSALAEAVQYEMENRKESQAEEEEENALSRFDAQLKLLEGKLVQAKILAEEARGLDTTGPISQDEKIRRRNLEGE